MGVCDSGWCRVTIAGNEGETYVSEPLLHADALPGTAPSTETVSRTGMTGRSDVCASYATQAQAQAAYDADPVGLVELDGNVDGVACESLRDGSSRTRARSTRARAAAPSRPCYTGPRGGRYYIDANGNRVYGC